MNIDDYIIGIENCSIEELKDEYGIADNFKFYIIDERQSINDFLEKRFYIVDEDKHLGMKAYQDGNILIQCCDRDSGLISIVDMALYSHSPEGLSLLEETKQYKTQVTLHDNKLQGGSIQNIADTVIELCKLFEREKIAFLLPDSPGWKYAGNTERIVRYDAA